jgi:hypothetical protein
MYPYAQEPLDGTFPEGMRLEALGSLDMFLGPLGDWQSGFKLTLTFID